MCKCKKCESKEYVKAGFVNGEQRYKCKKCGCQFVPTRHKGRSKQEKLLAVWMYAHGYSFRTIAKFFKVNVHSAFVWVKTFAKKALLMLHTLLQFLQTVKVKRSSYLYSFSEFDFTGYSLHVMEFINTLKLYLEYPDYFKKGGDVFAA